MDLIDRQAALDEIKNFKNSAAEWRDEQEDRSDIWHRADSAVASAIEIGLRIKKLPSAQRKGRIIIRSNMLDGEDCYCSECDHWALLPDYKFCPYCGVAFEDVISERETMEEYMYGQDMGNPEDGSL